MVKDKISGLAQEFHQNVIRIRRHLHSYPELSFQEHQTSAFIKESLNELGITWSSIAGTGVVAILEGNLPSANVIALRADIDALPIQEKNTADYSSRNAGVMHACGHDFHT